MISSQSVNVREFQYFKFEEKVGHFPLLSSDVFYGEPLSNLDQFHFLPILLYNQFISLNHDLTFYLADCANIRMC